MKMSNIKQVPSFYGLLIDGTFAYEVLPQDPDFSSPRQWIPLLLLKAGKYFFASFCRKLDKH